MTSNKRQLHSVRGMWCGDKESWWDVALTGALTGEIISLVQLVWLDALHLALYVGLVSLASLFIITAARMVWRALRIKKHLQSTINSDNWPHLKDLNETPNDPRFLQARHPVPQPSKIVDGTAPSIVGEIEGALVQYAGVMEEDLAVCDCGEVCGAFKRALHNCPAYDRPRVGGLKRAYYDMVQRRWDRERRTQGPKVDQIGSYSQWLWSEINEQ